MATRGGEGKVIFIFFVVSANGFSTIFV